MLLNILLWWQCFWQMLHSATDAGTSMDLWSTFLGRLRHLDVAARASKGAQKEVCAAVFSYEHIKWSLITWGRCHLRNGAENLGPSHLPSKLLRTILCMLLNILLWWQCFWQMLHSATDAGTSMDLWSTFLGRLRHLDVAARASKGAQKEVCAAVFSYEHIKWSLIT